MSTKHIIFDLDGTLIDSAPSILSGFARVLDQHGIKPRCELTHSLIGPPLIETLRRISGIDDPEILQGLADNFKRYYDEVGYRETREYPGITEALNNLCLGGASLYVVTNKRIVPTRRIIEFLHWGTFFKGLYSHDAFDPAASSKADVIKRVMTLHAMPREDTVYIGDREEDREAAEASRITFYFAGWGYGEFGVPSVDMQRVFARPSELGSAKVTAFPREQSHRAITAS